ncbi:MAG: DUF1461 domain-containing protein [Coriobacteriia bacterium]
MRRLLAALMGLCLAFVVIVLALQPVLTPQAVRALASRYSSPIGTGLSQERLLSAAEEVRAFTIDGSIDTLPETVDGRPGFDSAMVSHLRDVRVLIADVRFAAGIVAILVAAWLAVQGLRARPGLVAFAFAVAASLCVAVIAVAAVGALTDFDTFFRAFHRVFFPGGNWSFPSGSLLIEIFPETFWAAAGAVWAGLVIIGSAVLAVGAIVLKKHTFLHVSPHFSAGE